MRQLVYHFCYTRYLVSFYLWWIGSSQKYYKVPKYYDQGCRLAIKIFKKHHTPSKKLWLFSIPHFLVKRLIQLGCRYNQFYNILRLFDVLKSFHSPQVKRGAIITYKLGIYELSQELQNDLRLRILGNLRKYEKSI